MAKTNLLPKLTVPEMISHMRDDLGIKFNLISEEKAADFIQKKNTYFRIRQYAEDYEKKAKTGKYIDLEFGHLQELSTIDMYLRKLLLKMTIDTEHYLKVQLVNDCQNNPDDDGYAVVHAFLHEHPEIQKTIKNTYFGYNYDIKKAYGDDPAVWNLVEMLVFSDVTAFFEFYYKFFNKSSIYIKHFDSVRRIRNGSAHNNCLLRSLKPAQSFKFDLEEFYILSDAKCGLNPGEISSGMKVPVLNDFSVMLEVYSKIITSPRIKSATFKEMQDFFNGRMILHKDFFETNQTVKAAYKFAKNVLDYYAGKATD